MITFVPKIAFVPPWSGLAICGENFSLDSCPSSSLHHLNYKFGVLFVGTTGIAQIHYVNTAASVHNDFENKTSFYDIQSPVINYPKVLLNFEEQIRGNPQIGFCCP